MVRSSTKPTQRGLATHHKHANAAFTPTRGLLERCENPMEPIDGDINITANQEFQQAHKQAIPSPSHSSSLDQHSWGFDDFLAGLSPGFDYCDPVIESHVDNLLPHQGIDEPGGGGVLLEEINDSPQDTLMHSSITHSTALEPQQNPGLKHPFLCPTSEIGEDSARNQQLGKAAMSHSESNSIQHQSTVYQDFNAFQQTGSISTFDPRRPGCQAERDGRGGASDRRADRSRSEGVASGGNHPRNHSKRSRRCSRTRSASPAGTIHAPGTRSPSAENGRKKPTVPHPKDMARDNRGTDTGHEIFLVRHCTTSLEPAEQGTSEAPSDDNGSEQSASTTASGPPRVRGDASQASSPRDVILGTACAHMFSDKDLFTG
ncbi:hypothetical protein PCANC_05334 [Puccinia coronata f. sp. avenae]|uniref:Uncharacterized protein n=2 Tax=Puccinia coronata f. sp. avenae TaxID=200324 RepID=A0A2N5VXB6_9BASI|nr:hypothetical protein PCANC_05334 [Puccinia coronata f. sp. avenae]